MIVGNDEIRFAGNGALENPVVILICLDYGFLPVGRNDLRDVGDRLHCFLVRHLAEDDRRDDQLALPRPGSGEYLCVVSVGSISAAM